jgi:APA family basic amino acid/polyamine antiporter
MVGTGVFTTSGFLLKDLGSPWLVLLAWLAGGVIAALGALSYGALARRIPESGGEFIFLSRTIHPAAGFVAGWISLLVGFSAPLAAVAFGFGSYLAPWLPGVDPKLTGTVALAGFAVVHAVGVRFGSRAQDAIVAVKLLLILGFIWGGITRIQAIPPTSTPAAGLGAFLASLVWISFSYSGWNAAVYLGGEIRDPDRWLPRSLLIGTAITTALYLGLNAVFVLGVPAAKLSGQVDVGRIAAETLGGPRLAAAVTATILVALGTSLSAMIMAGPRVYAQMAAQGYLPRRLAALAGPPRAAIAFQLLVAAAMLWTTTYEALINYIGFTLGLSTALTVVGLARLRIREGSQLPVPGWPWVPAAFLVAATAMTLAIIARLPIVALWGGATVFLAWILWLLQARRRQC